MKAIQEVQETRETQVRLKWCSLVSDGCKRFTHVVTATSQLFVTLHRLLSQLMVL
jgi:hypothetical protein